MSAADGICDICGLSGSRGGEKVGLVSHQTGRLWCGVCETDYSAAAIAIWLFNADAPPIQTYLSGEEKVKIFIPKPRPSWDDYYLGIAEAVSARGDCARRRIGAVVVKDHRIVSTGYNGTPPGDSRSCGDSGQCPRFLNKDAKPGQGEYDACWATHAEANALLRADWASLSGATIYVTGSPCGGCAKLIASAGIDRVVHP